jgi:hypothetical protein
VNELTQTVDWSKLQIEPSDSSTCESCGLPGYSLKQVENWILDPQRVDGFGAYPDMGVDGECGQCHDRMPLYPPDKYTNTPLCGTCYGQARSAGVKDIVIHPAVAYKIPRIPWCCSISCLECVLFGPGRCHECGMRLGEKTKSFGKTEYDYHAGMKYCGICSKRPHPDRAEGERLLAYLRKYEPSLIGPPPERKKRAPNRSYLEKLNLPKSPETGSIAL